MFVVFLFSLTPYSDAICLLSYRLRLLAGVREALVKYIFYVHIFHVRINFCCPFAPCSQQVVFYVSISLPLFNFYFFPLYLSFKWKLLTQKLSLCLFLALKLVLWKFIKIYAWLISDLLLKIMSFTSSDFISPFLFCPISRVAFSDFVIWWK